MLFRDQYPRKNGLWNHWSLFHLEESYLLDLFLSRCISFSPLSGLTKFITSMDSCFWSSLSWQLSLFVLPLFALISFWMPRIIDGNCSFFIYLETVITIYFFKEWKPNFFFYFTGNGQVFLLPDPPVATYICILFTIFSSKRSK